MGKLIVSKGLDLLFAAWPLVVSEVREARLLVIGFGTYREALGRFQDALARADLDALHEIAARGRELEGGPPGPLRHLQSFLVPRRRALARGRAGGRHRGSTSPAGSSTTTCPPCCRPARRR